MLTLPRLPAGPAPATAAPERQQPTEADAALRLD